MDGDVKLICELIAGDALSSQRAVVTA
jgi:hypothetical protein